MPNLGRLVGGAAIAAAAAIAARRYRRGRLGFRSGTTPAQDWDWQASDPSAEPWLASADPTYGSGYGEPPAAGALQPGPAPLQALPPGAQPIEYGPEHYMAAPRRLDDRGRRSGSRLLRLVTVLVLLALLAALAFYVGLAFKFI